MSDDHMEETMPRPVNDGSEAAASQNDQTQDPQSSQSPPSQPLKRKRRLWRWGLGILLGLIVFGALGGLGGLQAGIMARQGQEQMQSAIEAVAQFQLGLADLENGNCDIARQRFQYVIELNPSYPDAANYLTQSLLCAGDTSGQEAAAPEATPTPDLRGADQLFSDAQNQLANQGWNELLASLDTLRKNFPDYQPLEVDRLYYLAFRNRGMVRIIPEGNLEGGIFDLNRAERIGPLDVQAVNHRQWAIWYVIGQSFWEVNWGEAVRYFEFVAPSAPNLHSGNFFTADQRLAEARIAYADELIQEAIRLGNLQGWCEANSLLNQAYQYAQPTAAPEIQPTLDWIRLECELNPDQISVTPTPGSN